MRLDEIAEPEDGPSATQGMREEIKAERQRQAFKTSRHEVRAGDALGELKKLPDECVQTCDCDAQTEPCRVLDPFCGAGTTGVVCEREGRQFIGIDLAEKYCRMTRERIGGEIRSRGSL